MRLLSFGTTRKTAVAGLRSGSAAARWRLATGILTLALLAAASGAAQAQAAPAAAPESAAGATLDSKALQGLVDTLKDDQARAKFVQELETLLEARREIEGRDAVGDTNGTWLSSLSDRLKDAVGTVFAVGSAFADLPRLLDEVAAGMRDAATRTHWLAVVGKIALILGAGYAAQLAARLLLARPGRAIGARGTGNMWRRTGLAVLRAVLDLLPLVAYGGAALAVASLTDPDRATRLAALALINARLATGVVMVVARLFLAPYTETLRTLPVTGETAHYLYIWVGRIGYVSIYGYLILEAMRLLGLPLAIHGFLLDALGLIVAILLIILILQNRDAVAERIRAPQEAGGPFAIVLRPLAAAWHLLAIFYVAALYLVLAIHGNSGTAYIVQGTVLTAVVVALAWAVENAGQRAVRRALTIREELQTRFPGLQMRLNRYTAAIGHGLRIFVYFVAAVAILEAWGADAIAWIVSPTGERVFAAIANIVLISVLAIVVWEVSSGLIERRLSTNIGGRAPTTRARTLLPLAQTALKVVLVVLVTMVVLSEVGVNITPLLAGAGVVGLAVGFGAQKLVQDVITGWFILMEDTLAVGDVAEVAGHAGLVERISIRTIRLRDLSGVVHTVPFSAVDSVKNFTKDFAYYLFEVGVAYREDTDEVVEVLRAVDAGMREDSEYGPDILEPLEVMGVDRFEDSAVIVRVRTKTRPLRQWAIGREFNRRMKKAFDAHGIEIPFPHRTIYFGVAKDDTAPPAHVRLERNLSEAFAGKEPPPEPGPAGLEAPPDPHDSADQSQPETEQQGRPSDG